MNLKHRCQLLLKCRNIKRDGLDSPEIFQEFMDILLKESYRMQNIINDILELSRLDQTRVKLILKN